MDDNELQEPWYIKVAVVALSATLWLGILSIFL